MSFTTSEGLCRTDSGKVAAAVGANGAHADTAAHAAGGGKSVSGGRKIGYSQSMKQTQHGCGDAASRNCCCCPHSVNGAFQLRVVIWYQVESPGIVAFSDAISATAGCADMPKT